MSVKFVPKATYEFESPNFVDKTYTPEILDSVAINISPMLYSDLGGYLATILTGVIPKHAPSPPFNTIDFMYDAIGDVSKLDKLLVKLIEWGIRSYIFNHTVNYNKWEYIPIQLLPTSIPECITDCVQKYIDNSEANIINQIEFSDAMALLGNALEQFSKSIHDYISAHDRKLKNMLLTGNHCFDVSLSENSSGVYIVLIVYEDFRIIAYENSRLNAIHERDEQA